MWCVVLYSLPVLLYGQALFEKILQTNKQENKQAKKQTNKQANKKEKDTIVC